MVQSPALSFIINAHREGGLLLHALNSALAARRACEAQGIDVEMVLVADKVDTATQSVIDRFTARIEKVDLVDYGNLGLSRRHALALSTAPFVCFLDGDDVWQETWPLKAYEFAQTQEYGNCVFHTEVFAGFGTSFFLRHQIQSTDTIFHPLHLAATWHYCNNLFAHRSIFERVPIQPYDHNEGYGSEDWHWSCETLNAGIKRLYVPETVYFYRLDPYKPSLGAVRGLVLRPTALFSDPAHLSSYETFAGFGERVRENDLMVMARLSRSQRVPRWLYRETAKATRVDLDIWDLRRKLGELHVATPTLYPTAAYMLSRVGLFCKDRRYSIVGLDCEEEERDLLALYAHGLRSFTDGGHRLVVLCGDVLTDGEYVRQIGNVLYVNYKMLLRVEKQNPYALDKVLGNIISNYEPDAILNINASFLDFFSGEYPTRLKVRGIPVVKLLRQPVHDFAAGIGERRLLAQLNQNLFWFSELWVTDEASALYLRHIYRSRDLTVRITEGRSPDDVVRHMLSVSRPVPADLPAAPAQCASAAIHHRGGVDMSCVLNLHREGNLMIPTLHSLHRMMQYAGRRNMGLELLIVLDDSDDATLDVLERTRRADYFGKQVRVIEVDHKNLAKSRRAGIEAARGEHVALLDGDDLYSQNWLNEAIRVCQGGGDKPVVCHPEVSVYFGTDHRVFWHPDSIDPQLDMSGLLLENYWTSLSVARRTLFQDLPLADLDLENGFGFEDWHWNMQAVAKGIAHRTAKRTAHFIRLKSQGSLNQLSAVRNVFSRPSEFSSLILHKPKAPPATVAVKEEQ